MADLTTAGKSITGNPWADALMVIAPSVIQGIGGGITGQATSDSNREIAQMQGQTSIQIEQMRGDIQRAQMEVEQAKIAADSAAAAMQAKTQRLATLQQAYQAAMQQTGQAANSSQDATRTLISAIQGPYSRGTPQLQGAYK